MPAAATTVSTLLSAARDQLAPGEAELLLAHALGRSRSWLFAHADDPLTDTEAAAFKALLQRRMSGVPVAYLLGSQGFWTLDLLVTPATLIPRPETELLVEQALARIPNDAAMRVSDLGTGSGAIALAIAKERPRAQVVAVDLSKDALDVARANAARNGIGNVEFRQGSWLEPLLGEGFDVIVSNPPYVADGDPHLAQGDLRFEPALALACGKDGLDAIRLIIGGASKALRPSGWLLFEHGFDQAAEVRSLLADAGFGEIEAVRDLEARDRVTLGRAP